MGRLVVSWSEIVVIGLAAGALIWCSSAADERARFELSAPAARDALAKALGGEPALESRIAELHDRQAAVRAARIAADVEHERRRAEIAALVARYPSLGAAGTSTSPDDVAKAYRAAVIAADASERFARGLDVAPLATAQQLTEIALAVAQRAAAAKRRDMAESDTRAYRCALIEACILPFAIVVIVASLLAGVLAGRRRAALTVAAVTLGVGLATVGNQLCQLPGALAGALVGMAFLLLTAWIAK